MTAEQIFIIHPDRHARNDLESALKTEMDRVMDYRSFPNLSCALPVLNSERPLAVIFAVTAQHPALNETVSHLRDKAGAPVIGFGPCGENEILVLEAGADDYLRDTASGRVLAGRLTNFLKRTDKRRASGDFHHAVSKTIQCGDMTLIPEKFACEWKGRAVLLTMGEYEILTALANASGRVLTRKQLADIHHSNHAHYDERSIDTHIKRIRRKFKKVDPAFDAILAVYGQGYRLIRENTQGIAASTPSSGGKYRPGAPI